MSTNTAPKPKGRGGFVVHRFADRRAMGAAAAGDIAATLRHILATQDGLRIMFAAAPSQAETLEALAAAKGIDWARVHAFHMDEYIGLPADVPQRFANWLDRHLFSKIPFGMVSRIDPSMANPAEAAARYAAEIALSPFDVVCLGIGVNGHLAFNDPPVADFADPLTVKVVELDEVCRKQQVDDGAFATVSDVPTHAVTVTVPALMAGRHLFCVAPGRMKREAVRRTLAGPIGTDCPSTILVTHPDCRLYLDADSGG